jgi:hypothetical protein
MLTLDGKARYLTSLNAQIDHAVLGVRRAQEELAVAVSGLVPVAVGDKKLITPGLQFSFEKLRTAQVYVQELQQLLARV